MWKLAVERKGGGANLNVSEKWMDGKIFTSSDPSEREFEL